MQTAKEQHFVQGAWHRLLLTLAISLLTITMLPAAALAQSGADEEQVAGVLEEVIVTSARRREENVQEFSFDVSLVWKDFVQ